MAVRALEQLTKEPAFRAEYHRLLEVLGPAEPWPTGFAEAGPPPQERFGPIPPFEWNEPDMEDLKRRWEEQRRMGDAGLRAWNERRRRRRASLREASKAFTATVRFVDINPSAVAWVLETALSRTDIRGIADVPGTLAPEYAGPLPMFYFNPTADRDLSVAIRPGRIFVDLTHASADDLAALAGSLSDLQARLGYRKPRGRQRKPNNEQMEMVHTLRTSPTGRGKVPRTR